MFTSFLFEKLSHYKDFYKTETEFIKHLMSGEVKVSVPDLINFQQEYEDFQQTAQFKYKYGEKVHLCLMPEDEISNSFPALTAIVMGRHSYKNKQKYDLEIRFYGDFTTRIYNVDEMFVLPWKDYNEFHIDTPKKSLAKTKK